ncbi:MAG: transcriptional regulator [Sandaracinaceae bacterium]|nr:transcriptional regulator [Sandaracinaceae bacterium]
MSAPKAREATLRESITVALRSPGGQVKLSVKELSKRVGASEKQVREHLEHVLQSAKARGERVEIEPARCRSCGFELESSTATRCPECKKERIAPARFALAAS